MQELNLEHVGWLRYPEGDLVLDYLSEGWFEYAERAFILSFLRSGDSFLDIGAHAGTHAAVARKACGPKARVICVEPNQSLHPYLQENVSNLELFDFAVSDTNGKIEFNVPTAQKTSFGHTQPAKQSKKQSKKPNPEGELITVPCKTMATLLKSVGLPKLTLVKVDIEGAEYTLFSGKTGPMIESGALIMIEFSNNNLERYGQSSKKLEKDIRNCGYEICTYDGVANKLVKAELRHPVWYENYLLCQNIEEANAKLAKRSRSRERICNDILQRGSACKALYDSRTTLEKERKIVEDACQNLNGLANHIESDGKAKLKPAANKTTDKKSPVEQLQLSFGRIKSVALYNLNAMQEKQAVINESNSHAKSLEDKLYKSSGLQGNERSQIEDLCANMDGLVDHIENNGEGKLTPLTKKSRKAEEPIKQLQSSYGSLKSAALYNLKEVQNKQAEIHKANDRTQSLELEIAKRTTTLDNERLIVADACHNLEELARFITSNGETSPNTDTASQPSEKSTERLQNAFGEIKSVSLYNLESLQQKQAEINATNVQLSALEKEFRDSAAALARERAIVEDTCANLAALVKFVENDGQGPIEASPTREIDPQHSIEDLTDKFGSIKSVALYNLQSIQDKEKEIHKKSAEVGALQQALTEKSALVQQLGELNEFLNTQAEESSSAISNLNKQIKDTQQTLDERSSALTDSRAEVGLLTASAHRTRPAERSGCTPARGNPVAATSGTKRRSKTKRAGVDCGQTTHGSATIEVAKAREFASPESQQNCGRCAGDAKSPLDTEQPRTAAPATTVQPNTIDADRCSDSVSDSVGLKELSKPNFQSGTQLGQRRPFQISQPIIR